MKVKTIFILLMALVFAEKILTHEESIQRHKDVLSSKFLLFQNEVNSFMYGSGPTEQIEIIHHVIFIHYVITRGLLFIPDLAV